MTFYIKKIINIDPKSINKKKYSRTAFFTFKRTYKFKNCVFTLPTEKTEKKFDIELKER